MNVIDNDCLNQIKHDYEFLSTKDRFLDIHYSFIKLQELDNNKIQYKLSYRVFRPGYDNSGRNKYYDLYYLNDNNKPTIYTFNVHKFDAYHELIEMSSKIRERFKYNRYLLEYYYNLINSFNTNIDCDDIIDL